MLHFAPPPPSAPKICKSRRQCQFECAGGASFDLSDLKSQLPPQGYFHAFDRVTCNYYFGACGPVAGVTCNNGQARNAVAIQSWGGQPPSLPADTCAVLGDYSSMSCAVADPASGFECNFTGGADDRAVTFTYTCDPTIPVPQFSVSEALGYPPVYVITIVGSAACPVKQSPRTCVQPPAPPSPDIPPPSNPNPPPASQSLRPGDGVLPLVSIVVSLVSYLLQYIRLLRTRCSEGLSALTPTLALLATFLNLCSTLLVKWRVRRCARESTRPPDLPPPLTSVAIVAGAALVWGT